MDKNIFEYGIAGKKTPLPESQVKHIIYQVLKAIEHSHKNGIFHRDIVPENILIDGDVIKLADFGSCRFIKSK